MENNDTGWLVYKTELEWLPGGLERMPNEIVISNSQKYIPFQKLESANAEIAELKRKVDTNYEEVVENLGEEIAKLKEENERLKKVEY